MSPEKTGPPSSERCPPFLPDTTFITRQGLGRCIYVFQKALLAGGGPIDVCVVIDS